MQILHTKYESQYPWPDDTYLQGGDNGIVFTSNGTSYRTAFVEVFTQEGFIRGEGETVLEAEVDCWNKYNKIITCTDHQYETRGYKNSGGICKNCQKFAMYVFTAEELGQYCWYCNVPTLHFWKEYEPVDTVFACVNHTPVDGLRRLIS